ncbi:type II secretory pathway protein [Burkholderia pseudomallei]|nr:type II secretory pathway protein [Burkholderia pseudomallei]
MTARAMRGFDRARIRGAPRGASRSRAFGVERSLFARSSMERRWNADGAPMERRWPSAYAAASLAE